ncbi:hypothetical protein BD311DRAFT_767369 [Dichomitus squalens]|uniref:Uncharacterized protein n=1 Tax=Dichomitus squalens TaxID=114155 RepID=A0A4Q9MCJ0_9APHY|nr:hypothetical protein BD311DRAFT_767369 [Dichomitus squalens]
MRRKTLLWRERTDLLFWVNIVIIAASAFWGRGSAQRSSLSRIEKYEPLRIKQIL